MIWRSNYVKGTQDTTSRRKTRGTAPNEGDLKGQRAVMDTTPPPIFAEMQAMKEQMEVMMNALKGRVSSDLDDLVNRTNSPFTILVNSGPLPQKF